MIRTVSLVLCSAAALLATAAAPAADDPARFAPTDTLVYLGIADLKEFGEGMDRTAVFKMLDDPAAGAAGELNFFSKIVDQARKGFATALKVDPDKLGNPFGGNLAVFLHPTEKVEEPGFVAVVGVSDQSMMQDYYGRLIDRFKTAADTYEREEFSGANLDVFTATPKEPEIDPEELGFDPNSDPFGLDDDAMTKLIDQTFGQWFSGETLPERLAVCLHQEHLYIGQTAGQLKDVLRRARGADSLVGHDDHKFLLQRFKPIGNLRVFINVPRLVELATAEDESTRKGLGLDGFGALVGHSRFGGPDEYESKFEMLQIIKGQRSGIPQLLSVENVDYAPDRAVSSDACLFMAAHLDASRIIDEVIKMVRQFDAGTADEMVAGLGEVETPDGKLNVRKDIIGNLRPPLQFMLLTGRPLTPDNMRMMLALGHRDRGAMARLLEMVRSSLPMQPTDRDFEGHTLYEMPIGGVSMCANADTLMVGSTGAVEAQLRGAAGKPLTETKAWRQAREYMPDKAWAVVFVDARLLFEAGLSLADKREQVMGMAMVNAAPAAVLGMAESLAFMPKEGQAEQGRQLMKYLAPSMMTVATTPDGLLVTQVQLRPETR